MRGAGAKIWDGFNECYSAATDEKYREPVRSDGLRRSIRFIASDGAK